MPNLTEKQLYYLQEMGIQVWQQRNIRQSMNVSENCGEDNTKIWQDLENQVSGCTLCELHKTRTHTVFGIGNKKADLMFIGEAPGATEDARGEPFVGRAGLLLDSMLAAISLHRKDVFIANVLKCRPPNNRDPLPREVELCTGYLRKQIELIEPKLIVAVGRIAAHFLLGTNESMGKLRGRLFHYGEKRIPLMVTYHPAYLLRSPREKSKAYQDLLRIQQIIEDNHHLSA